MIRSAEILKEIRRELKRLDRPENKIDAQRFHKEKLKKRYVLKSPLVRRVSARFFKEVKIQPKESIFDLCEEMFESGKDGESSIAFNWARRLEKQYAKSDFRRFETWLKKYVNGWGSCDALCCYVLGPLIYKFPELAEKTAKWTKSKSRWYRRASAVTLIYPVRRRILLELVFERADILLLDDDDMVQKGYGWMLKEASNKYRDEVYDFVLKRRDKMPRTALRYAIEKLPPAMKKEAMKKG